MLMVNKLTGVVIGDGWISPEDFSVLIKFIEFSFVAAIVFS